MTYPPYTLSARFRRSGLVPRFWGVFRAGKLRCVRGIRVDKRAQFQGCRVPGGGAMMLHTRDIGKARAAHGARGSRRAARACARDRDRSRAVSVSVRVRLRLWLALVLVLELAARAPARAPRVVVLGSVLVLGVRITVRVRRRRGRRG